MEQEQASYPGHLVIGYTGLFSVSAAEGRLGVGRLR